MPKPTYLKNVRKKSSLPQQSTLPLPAHSLSLPYALAARDQLPKFMTDVRPTSKLSPTRNPMPELEAIAKPPPLPLAVVPAGPTDALDAQPATNAITTSTRRPTLPRYSDFP